MTGGCYSPQLTRRYLFHVIEAINRDRIASIHNTGAGTGDNGLVVRADGGDPLLVQSDTANLLTVKQNRNVGIGTADPRSLLELRVDGTDHQNATTRWQRK